MKPKLLCCFLFFLVASVTNAQERFNPTSKILNVNESGYFDFYYCEYNVWHSGNDFEFSTDNGVTWKSYTQFDGKMQFVARPSGTPDVGELLEVKGNRAYGTIKIRHYEECAETGSFIEPYVFLPQYYFYITVTIGSIPPTVTTTDASSVATTSATLGGNVTDDGSATVTERGIVWATTADPTTANNKVQISSGTGVFSQSITSLPSGTTINFRAYAKNSQGTSYGANKTFTTTAAGITASINASTNVKCRGASTGAATVLASGGGAYTYSWAPTGGSAATASNLVAGNYTVTVTSGASTATATVTVTQPATALSASITAHTDVSGSNDGSATVTAAGGTPSYTYVWTPSGGTGVTASNLAVGTYTVTVTDANTCTATASISLSAAQTYFSPASATLSVGETGDFVIPECNLTVWTHFGPYFSTDNGVTWKDATTDFDGTMTFESNFLPGGGVGGILSVKANKYYAPIKVRYYYLCSDNYEVDPSAPYYAVSKYWYNTTITFNNTTPTVTTADASSVAATSATLGGNVTNDGGASVTERGIVWATTANPTTANNKVQIGTGTGAFSQSITSLPSGAIINFRAYAKNAQGTSYGTNNTFITPAGITASISNSTNVKCRGASTGTATVLASGGGAYTYSWAPSGGSAATASNLVAGNYTVTVTSGASTATATVAITQPAAALSAIISNQTQVSVLPANGSATVTASGGTPSYTYNWTPTGGTATTALNLAVGTYTVTVSDANTCTATATVNIVAIISASITSSTNVKCYGASTGSATVTASGGEPVSFTKSPSELGAPPVFYNYSWAPSGGNFATASNLAAGIYTVTVSLSTLSVTATVNITQPATAVSAAITAHTDVSGNTNGSATVTTTGGTPSYTYVWSPSGGTSAAASNLTAGTYTVSVTDANTCTATATVTIAASLNYFSPATKTINVGESARVELPVCQSTVWENGSTVEWSTDNGATWKDQSEFTGGTMNYAKFPSPDGGFEGRLLVGSPTMTGTIMVRYYRRCSVTNNATVNPIYYNYFTVTIVTTTPTVSTTNAASIGTTTATLGGSVDSDGGESVSDRGIVWATTANPTTTDNKVQIGSGVGIFSQIISSLPVGTLINFRAYAINTKGTSYGTNKTFTTLAPLSASIDASTNILCYGASTGSATVTASSGTSPYSYSWSPSNKITATASNLAAGTYTVTVTDASSSTATATITITQPAAAVSAIISSQTVVTTPPGNNGTAAVTASGGTPSYTYSWTPSGGAAATGSNLSVGTYTVTVTDANGCTATPTANITPPPTHKPLVSTIEATNIGVTTATLGGVIEDTGGENVTERGILWGITGSPTLTNKVLIGSAGIGLFSGIVTDLPSATGIRYQAFATNINGTGYGGVRTLTTLAPLTASISASTNVACYGASTGSATVTASGGTTPYTYSWSANSATAATISNLAIGTYTVTVTDASSSTATATVTITQPVALSLISSPQSPIECGTGTVELIASGGTSSYTYNWSHTLTPSPTGTNLQSGTYIGTVTDANTCTANITILVLPPPAPPTLVLTGDIEICVDERTTISAQGCAGIVTWSNGHVGYSLNAPIGTYTATCTVNGCSSTSSSPAIVGLRSDCNALTITPVNVTLCPGKTVTLKVTGCVGNVTWSTGASGTSITVSTTGQYIATCSTGGVGAATVRTYNATLNIGTNVILGTEVIKAIETITANNIIGAPIYEKPNVSYSAGKSILLTPGFKVVKGSVFEATIGGCNN